MRATRVLLGAVLALAAGACERAPEQITGGPPLSASASVAQRTIGINVLLSGTPTAAQLAELGTYGRVSGGIAELNAVFMRTSATQLPAIQALPYVVAANPDAERKGSPVDAVAVSNFAGGFNTWDLDAINVTPGPFATTRSVPFDGSGVYIGVLDTGLLDSWRQYFPQERIAEQYATAISGGGQNHGATPFVPNQWEHDQNSHGTHVTSTILGYRFRTANIDGVAPLANVIPVKVLNQSGFGWSSVIATGIMYIADLKAGPLAGHPMVINMSLGGSQLDALERAAIDYAIAQGVIVVAAAGNDSTAGMNFPGAYAPVISVAASGWIREWLPAGNASWWLTNNVAEPTNPNDFYIASFSSRQKTGQDLDVAAPGSWVVGPFQFQSGKTSYFFLGGTSQATPHVAGIVALMAQKDPSLTASQAEGILEATAIPLPAGCRMVPQPAGPPQNVCWGDDATGAGLATADAALAGTP